MECLGVRRVSGGHPHHLVLGRRSFTFAYSRLMLNSLAVRPSQAYNLNG